MSYMYYKLRFKKRLKIKKRFKLCFIFFLIITIGKKKLNKQALTNNFLCNNI